MGRVDGHKFPTSRFCTRNAPGCPGIGPITQSQSCYPFCFGVLDLAAFDVIRRVIFGVELNGIRGERDGTIEAAKATDQPMSKDSVAIMPVVPKPDIYNIICFVIQSVERTFISFFQPLHHWLIGQSPNFKQT